MDPLYLKAGLAMSILLVATAAITWLAERAAERRWPSDDGRSR